MENRQGLRAGQEFVIGLRSFLLSTPEELYRSSTLELKDSPNVLSPFYPHQSRAQRPALPSMPTSGFNPSPETYSGLTSPVSQGVLLSLFPKFPMVPGSRGDPDQRMPPSSFMSPAATHLKWAIVMHHCSSCPNGEGQHLQATPGGPLLSGPYSNPRLWGAGGGESHAFLQMGKPLHREVK